MNFSIITPSFRNSAWLRLCVASVADQDIACEHIVQDAGSDDGTLDWLLNDRRVKAFVESDAGMYDAVNRGLARAQGDIIAYLNCDEQYLPGALRMVADYFATHPEVEVLFGDAVAVDADGDYLFHRKSLTPRLWHTWTWPLATLTCATFFRRSLVDSRRIVFAPEWKIIGDSEWMLRIIQSGTRMAVLHRFTSVFAITGANLSLNPVASAEAGRLRATAPLFIRVLKHPVLLHHRLRRWLGGVYRQEPFSFKLYTASSATERVRRDVAKPTSRWRW